MSRRRRKMTSEIGARAGRNGASRATRAKTLARIGNSSRLVLAGKILDFVVGLGLTWATIRREVARERAARREYG